MKVNERVLAFAELGEKLRFWVSEYEYGDGKYLESVVRKAFYANGWFDKPQVLHALKEVGTWLQKSELDKWVGRYDFDAINRQKTIGVIMAGNIPLVGYHDYLSVLMSGHKLLGKLSRKDEVLLRFLHDELLKIEPRFGKLVEFTTGRFSVIDAVIATGSNNSSRYFDYYFSNIPHIIRKNRTSVAILSGDETVEDLMFLGEDIFRYYGLGCRNVTKVYFPKGFDVSWFYNGMMAHSRVMENHKYLNNYEYHRSLYLLNKDKIWDNHFLILKRDISLSSPVGVLFYEEYEDTKRLQYKLQNNSHQIQCVIGVGGLSFGWAQRPKLTDYSDNINVLQFLLGL